MTPNEVKQDLLKLVTAGIEDFTLIFSGKKSKKVNGLYYLADRKIVINDRNFEGADGKVNESLLFYTAMHEFAHHYQSVETGQKSGRIHTQLFYAILDTFAARAEELGLYSPPADANIQALADEAEKISRQIAALQKHLGKVLSGLQEACERQGIRYEDIVSRRLRLSAKTEKKAKKIYALDLPDGIGMDVQEAIAGERDSGKRQQMTAAAKEGKSAVQVKQAAARPPERKNESEAERLLREKERLEKTIAELNRRLREIVRRLNTGGLHGHGERNGQGAAT